jgi:hypothetical protein
MMVDYLPDQTFRSSSRKLGTFLEDERLAFADALTVPKIL